MTRSRRKRPSSPRVIPESQEPGLNVQALALPANSDVEVRASTRQHEKGAHRKDVFELLSIRKRGPKRDQPPLLNKQLVEASVRRLETDIHLAAGVANTHDGERRGGPGCQERITQRQIAASRRIYGRDGVLEQIGRQHASLAIVLLAPETQGSVITRWRGHVQRITGKRDEDGQADVILWLCASVAAAYQALDYGERRRA